MTLFYKILWKNTIFPSLSDFICENFTVLTFCYLNNTFEHWKWSVVYNHLHKDKAYLFWKYLFNRKKYPAWFLFSLFPYSVFFSQRKWVRGLSISHSVCVFSLLVFLHRLHKNCPPKIFPLSISMTRGRSLFLIYFWSFYASHKYKFLHIVLNSSLCKTLKKWFIRG